MKFLLFICALAQFVNAQSGSTGSLQGAKKQDIQQGLLFSGGGSVIIGGGKKQEALTTAILSIDSGNPIINGGNGKKSDFTSDSGGNTTVGGTVDTLGKKKDFAMMGEPIKIADPKKKDYSSFDSGGNGAVLGTGGIKRDYCESGGTGVSSGSTTSGTGSIGKKSDLHNC